MLVKVNAVGGGTIRVHQSDSSILGDGVFGVADEKRWPFKVGDLVYMNADGKVSPRRKPERKEWKLSEAQLSYYQPEIQGTTYVFPDGTRYLLGDEQIQRDKNWR